MSERRTRFCSNCGAEIDVRAKICPKCGVEQVPLVEEVSSLWYLVPFFLTWIGGLIAWYVNKDRNPRKARNFLIFGLIWASIVTVLGVIIYVYIIKIIIEEWYEEWELYLRLMFLQKAEIKFE